MIVSRNISYQIYDCFRILLSYFTDKENFNNGRAGIKKDRFGGLFQYNQ